MGVYIKDMMMPSDCGQCDFLSGLICPDNVYHCYAPVSKKNYSINVTENVENWNRPDWCPLVEVPTPHGDLIDGHKMEFSKKDREDGGETWLWKADTIIPAEE